MCKTNLPTVFFVWLVGKFGIIYFIKFRRNIYDKKINTNFDYNEEVRKCKTIDDVMGKNGLIQRLVKDVLENILEGEMEEISKANSDWYWRS